MYFCPWQAIPVTRFQKHSGFVCRDFWITWTRKIRFRSSSYMQFFFFYGPSVLLWRLEAGADSSRPKIMWLFLCSCSTRWWNDYGHLHKLVFPLWSVHAHMIFRNSRMCLIWASAQNWLFQPSITAQESVSLLMLSDMKTNQHYETSSLYLIRELLVCAWW